MTERVTSLKLWMKIRSSVRLSRRTLSSCWKKKAGSTERPERTKSQRRIFYLQLESSIGGRIIKYVRIDYVSQEISPSGRSYWRVEIESRFMMRVTTYVIDGETGEFSKEETFEMRYE